MQHATKPRRPRFFYGWIIVFVSSVAEMTAYGAGTASFAVFLQPMSTALGWSRTLLTGAVTLQSFANLVISPIVGVLIDRFSPRVIMVSGAVTAGISYMLMERVSEPWHFYLLFTGASAFGLHEVGSLVGTTVVSKWFVRRRGRALAFTSLGNNLGGMLLGPTAAFLISTLGWRAAWAVVGLLVVLIVLPPTILFMRRAPEDMGLRPDGDPPEPSPTAQDLKTTPHRRAREEPRWGVRDAFRTRTMWLLVLSFNFASVAVSGMINHQVAYFRDIGLSLQAASLVYSFNQFFAVASKLLWGFLAERISVRYCMTLTYLGRMAALLTLVLGTAKERVYVYAVISGLLGGGIGVLQPLIWADYYGRAFLGSIRGATAPFSLISGIGGPLLAAYIFDSAGSYDGALWIFVGTLLLGAIFQYFAKPPGLAPAKPDQNPTSAPVVKE